jgi:hypothetical protein
LGGLFRIDAVKSLLADDDRPTLAFFDFDPKGLSMAASLDRREALCLPAWEDLETSVKRHRRAHLYANSYDVSRGHLEKIRDPEIALAWMRMRRLTLGLDQEGFPR